MRHFESLEPRLQFNGGDLDTTFGDNGTAAVDFAPALPAPWQMLAEDTLSRDDGGRVYALARAVTTDAGPRRLVIARLSRDGHLDHKFAGDGFRILDRDPTNSFEGSIYTATDPNNRTYVVDGTLIWRLTPAGKIDHSFGRHGRGKIAVPILFGGDSPVLGFDAGGHPLLSGASQVPGGTVMTVVRLSENGSVDTTWADDGVFRTRLKSSTAKFENSATGSAGVLSSGQIMLSGTFRTDDGDGTWVARLNTDGSLDTTYGQGGYAEANFDGQEIDGQLPSSTNNQPVSVLPDGSVLGFMSAIFDDNEGGFSREFNFTISPDGRRIDMIQLVPPPGFVDWGVLAQPDGKLITFGDTGLVRVNRGGGTDPTWHFNSTPAPVPFEPGHLAPDGSAIIFGPGLAAGDRSKVFIRRLFRDDAPVPQFDGRNVTAPRASAVRFSVTWRDDDGIDSVTFDSLDVRVRGPFDGQSRWHSVTLDSVTPLADGRFRAIYKLTSPNGWTAADNGDYRVRLMSGQVEDETGNFAPAGTLGTFRVSIS